MPTDHKISDSARRRQGFRPIGQAAHAVQETLRERLLRAVAEDRAEFLTDDEDAVRCKYLMPIALMLMPRWDDAAEAAWADTRKLIDDPDLDLVIEGLFFSADESTTALTKEDWNEPLGLVAEALEASGHVAEGIAWRMLQADPQQPWTFARFMPQLEHLIREQQPTLPKAVVDELSMRIKVWRQASNGSFAHWTPSVFRIAETELAHDLRILNQNGGVVPHPIKTLGDRARDRAQAEARKLPGVIAIPKEAATKLIDREGHAGFGDIVGAHLPHVLAPDLARVRRALLAEYPHSAVVIDMLLRDLREGRPAVIKPILIVGEPGGGKSRVVRRLGELLGMHVQRYDASGSSDNMFAGMSKGWSGTQPAVPVRGLALAKSPTFIMMVDELEKAATRTYAGTLWAAMGPFLEKETSARFRDPSLDCEVDLSFVSHIATANNIEPLPPFLRDRYRVVRWPMPTLDHLPVLAANVLAEIEREAGEVGMNAPLEADELEVIGRVWKRQRFSMRKLQKLVSATLDARAATAPRH